MVFVIGSYKGLFGFSRDDYNNLTFDEKADLIRESCSVLSVSWNSLFYLLARAERVQQGSEGLEQFFS
jgi:hypothetical protein